MKRLSRSCSAERARPSAVVAVLFGLAGGGWLSRGRSVRDAKRQTGALVRANFH